MKLFSEAADRSLLAERVLLSVAALAYLLLFDRTVPHGDALRVVSQIHSGVLSWNPNHLFFDPLGYGWFQLLGKIGFEIAVLDSFEIISGFATIVSLLVFHAALLAAGVRSRVLQLLAIVGLFASRSFLSLATNQYYFMVQMPFLLGALYLALRFLTSDSDDRIRNHYLYGIGALTAVAGTILFSNVLLVAALGIIVGFLHGGQIGGWRRWKPANAARLWGAAALVGFPAYMVGYALSGSDAGFPNWLFSYQGESASSLTELYRVHWDLRSIAESLTRLGFNFFSASILESAGFGTYLRTLFFQETPEFVPEIFRVTLVVALMPLVIAMVILAMVWILRRLRSDAQAALAFAWILPYLVFNFLWSVGGDHFWVQVVPVVWLAWCRSLDRGGVAVFRLPPGSSWWHAWETRLTIAVVPILLFMNTFNSIIPVSGKHDVSAARYHALLRDGDLEILPGWEVIGWLRTEYRRPNVERLQLMSMALLPVERDGNIRRLPEIVARHLASGRRVVVGRLYDRDHEVNPWYNLQRLGWPRARIQSLLVSYCLEEVGRVEDVVYREIRNCHRD